jgi:hypothetical protein
MNLFRNLFSHDGRRNAGKPFAPRIRGTITIAGENERLVYTYDGTPLKGIVKGQWFDSVVARGEVTMRSTATGTVANSKEFDDLPIMVGGMPYGFVGAFHDSVRSLQSAGYEVAFRSRRIGTYMKGIPEVNCYIPPTWWFLTWTRMFLAFDGEVSPNTEESEIVKFSRDESEWLGGSVGKDVPMHMSLVLGEANGRTKPHVLLMSGESRLVELPAKVAIYRELLPYIGRPAFGLVSRMERKGREGCYYSISILFSKVR